MDTDAITELLALWQRGNSDAARTLVPLVYQQLRAIARRQLGGAPSQTLNTTALVHEAYLKLGHRSRFSPENRHHFFAVAAKAMRQLIVDHARRRAAEKRGGQAEIVTVDDTDVAVPATAEQIIDLNAALDRLSEIDDRLARLVELRFFAGLSVEETAAAMDCSPRTIKRDWRKARAFLYGELTDGEHPS
jgi:RNA polymerase sigma factor (TIGR02999 family)